MAVSEPRNHPLSGYPGAPLSRHFLDRPWEFDTAYGNNDFAQLFAWKGSRSWKEGRGGSPCADSWKSPREEVKNYMSQYPYEPGPPYSTSRQTEQSTRHGKSPQSTTAHSEAVASTVLHISNEVANHSKPETPIMFPPPPPEQQQQPAVHNARPPSRTFGVQSILNPPQPDALVDFSKEHRASTASNLSLSSRGSPSSNVIEHLPALSPRILKRSVRGSPSVEALSLPSSAAHEGRRILTPRSPGVRAASLGSRSEPLSSNVSLQTSSGSSGGRVYTAEPGPHTDIPPLPSAAIASRFMSPYPPVSYPSRIEPRRASGGRETISAPVSSSVPATQTEDPSTSNSSYSQFSRASPAVRYGDERIAQGVYPHHQTAQSLNHPQHGPPPSAQGEAHYDVGHGSYRMTLDTESGPMIVPVEVDLQQASKMADEKRKRNAGASARFRARRKEKEKEANTTIDSLQTTIRDLTEDREFYLGERDFYRDFIARALGPNQVPQRPPSPRARRLLPPPAPSQLGHEDPSSRWRVTSREGTESPTRSQRRRTGDYQPSFGHHPSPSPMIQPSPTTYGPSFAIPPPLAALPPSHLEPQPPRTTNPPLPPTQSVPYDPFRRENYDRSWNPGR